MATIVILGGGESGVGSAILAKKEGFDVFVSDNGNLKDKYKKELIDQNIPYEENNHHEDRILSATEIIKSPGISNQSSIVRKAVAKGIPILSEMEFAKRFTNAKMICVTGSNGKTTTTSLIYHILKSAGLNVGVAGNIGKSFARQVATENFDYYVLELSSFQLENMYAFKADIAIVLNISPDHLDRYDYDMQKYVDAKMRIARNQTENEVLIFWENDPLISKEIEKLAPKSTKYTFSDHKTENTTAYAENDKIYINTPNSSFSMDQSALALSGTHNLYNSLVSGITAKLLDISNNKIQKSLSDFEGVEHRLEKVAKVKGVQFINDSKATNVNSCWYALQSMQTKTILILGGTDKGNDYSQIEDLVKEKVKALVFLGTDNSKLHKFFDNKINKIADATSTDEAVAKAFSFAEEGDTVLLSPCCASFDLFKNYEDRGEKFKESVRKL